MGSTSYICNGRERLLPIEGVPPPLIGAPELTFVRADGLLAIAYYVDDGDRGPVSDPKPISETGHEHRYAVIRMREFCVMLAPRGEVGHDDHPLTRNIGEMICEVKPSPWVRQVDPPSGWSKFKRSETHWHHYLFALHDDLLEVIGEIQDVTIHQGPLELAKLIQGR